MHWSKNCANISQVHFKLTPNSFRNEQTENNKKTHIYTLQAIKHLSVAFRSDILSNPGSKCQPVEVTHGTAEVQRLQEHDDLTQHWRAHKS